MVVEEVCEIVVMINRKENMIELLNIFPSIKSRHGLIGDKKNLTIPQTTFLLPKRFLLLRVDP